MRRARATLRLDGLFRLLVAGIVLAATASGADIEAAFGLDWPVVAAVGAALIPGGVMLLLARPERATLLTAAGVNIASAAALVIFLGIEASTMNAFGLGVTSGALAGWAALAALELTAARRVHGRSLVR